MDGALFTLMQMHRQTLASLRRSRAYLDDHDIHHNGQVVTDAWRATLDGAIANYERSIAEFDPEGLTETP